MLSPFQLALDFLFPTNCLGCGRVLSKGAVCCAACADAVPIHQELLQAAAPYRYGAATAYHQTLPQRLVQILKFENGTAAAAPLGQFLIRYLTRLHLPLENSLVIPVPLHSARERIRGYNQSALIASSVAHYFGLPLDATTLFRTRFTPPQHELPRAARLENVRGCFSADPRPELRNRTILLIDDVLTSGATLQAAAEALFAAQATEVIALAVAHA